jgi:hypothetical protein
MRAIYSKPYLLFILFFAALLTLGSCTRGSGSNRFARDDAEVSENVKNAMGLSVGMTRGQVFDLCGVANYVEGYDWGYVWFYKTKTGSDAGTLADKKVEELYTPVVFENTDRVSGYGRKMYEQTLSDLGAGQF